MITALFAVVGTLLGAVTTALLQQRGARAERRAAHADLDRRERIAAVAALVAALADHRRTMWVRESLRLAGAPAVEYEVARADSHGTRSAISAPLVTVEILAPALATAAGTATAAAYALRGATDRHELDRLRAAAIAAADDLVRAAAWTT
ncbi:protein kilB [Streptomyces sp. LE64]|uniref:protein kilB n=1 Tax=Streptomyces sp. LE64 TaxID=3448653 RepID=UPI004041173A